MTLAVFAWSDRVMTTKDMAALRKRPWFRDLLDLKNWTEVAEVPRAGLYWRLDDIADDIMDGEGFKATRLDAYRRIRFDQMSLATGHSVRLASG